MLIEGRVILVEFLPKLIVIPNHRGVVVAIGEKSDGPIKTIRIPTAAMPLPFQHQSPFPGGAPEDDIPTILSLPPPPPLPSLIPPPPPTVQNYPFDRDYDMISLLNPSIPPPRIPTNFFMNDFGHALYRQMLDTLADSFCESAIRVSYVSPWIRRLCNYTPHAGEYFYSTSQGSGDSEDMSTPYGISHEQHSAKLKYQEIIETVEPIDANAWFEKVTATQAKAKKPPPRKDKRRRNK